jgi:cytochrome c biogenesis protein CcmG/thiol:disulfide interchange protein DsbE
MTAILRPPAPVVKDLFGLTLPQSIAKLVVMDKSMAFTLFFCALTAIVLPAAVCAEDAASPFEGMVLRDLEGASVAIDSLLDKGPLVMNFWATWCLPCRKEMPHLEKIYSEFASKGVQFAAVSVDRPDHISRIQSLLRTEKMTIPVYHDSDTELAKAFRVRSIPTTVIIGRDRKLVYTNKGYRAGDEIVLRKRIQSLIESEAAEPEGKAGGPEAETGGGEPAGAGDAEEAGD